METIDRLSIHARTMHGASSCPRITPNQAYLIVIRDSVALDAAVKEAYVCEHGTPPPNFIPLAQRAVLEGNVTGQSESIWQQTKEVSQDTLAVIDASIGRLAHMPGTRVLVLASGGFLSAQLEREQDKIIDHALRSNVVINSLDAKGLTTDAPKRAANEARGGNIPISTFKFEKTTAGMQRFETVAALANLAASTGGQFFQNNNDLELGFDQLGAAPETSYRLGFAAADVKADAKYHKLKVRLDSSTSDRISARHRIFCSRANERSIRIGPGTRSPSHCV